MKGVQGEMLWLIVSIVILIVFVAIFLIAMPSIMDNLSAFGLRALEWIKKIF